MSEDYEQEDPLEKYRPTVILERKSSEPPPRSQDLQDIARVIPSMLRRPGATSRELFKLEVDYLVLDKLGISFDAIDIGNANPDVAAERLRRTEHLRAHVLGPPTAPPGKISGGTQMADESKQILSGLKTRKRIHNLAEPEQRYLGPADDGIDAWFAWQETKGKCVELADIEQGWVKDHLEFDPPACIANDEMVNHDYFGHGTAALGVVGANDDNYGCVGVAPDIEKMSGYSQWRKHPFHRGMLAFDTASAITDAAEALQHTGAILLIEAQTTYRGTATLLPVEVERPVFLAIQNAVQLGVVVIEAAGNGEIDMDAWVDRRGISSLRWRRRDSGAIMVGACEPEGRARYRSNYGSRVDCFAWGSGVYTAGDGYRSKSSYEYTNNFSGTSAAAAIVAGAAALIQSFVKIEDPCNWLDSYTMRSYLEMGTPSRRPAQDRIGVMPNLKEIFESLYARRKV